MHSSPQLHFHMRKKATWLVKSPRHLRTAHRTHLHLVHVDADFLLHPGIPHGGSFFISQGVFASAVSTNVVFVWLLLCRRREEVEAGRGTLLRSQDNVIERSLSVTGRGISTSWLESESNHKRDDDGLAERSTERSVEQIMVSSCFHTCPCVSIPTPFPKHLLQNIESHLMGIIIL